MEREICLSQDECELLLDALDALRDKRGQQWLASCRIADEQGRAEPPLNGIDTIEALAKRLGGQSKHWMDR